MITLKRTAIASVAALALSASALVAPASAAGPWHGGGGFHHNGGWHGGGRWHGGGWGAAGVGLTAGALAGAAVATPYYYNGYPGYDGFEGPGYYRGYGANANNWCYPGESMYDGC
jgi:hypothetical protein